MKFITVLALLLPLSVWAQQDDDEGYQDSETETVENKVQAEDEELDRFKVGSKSYPYGLDGFRDYMQDLRKDNPKLYERLNPEVESMSRNQVWGSYVGFPLLVSGVGLMGWGIFRTGEGKPGNAMVLAGAGLGALGGYLFFVMRPSSQKLWNFMRKHNKLNSKNPMRTRWSWNFQITPSLAELRGGQAALTLRF